MRRTKIGFVFVAILMTLGMLLSACAAPAPTTAPATSVAATTAAAVAETTAAETPAATAAEPVSSQASPLGKYDPPITLTTIRGIEPSRTFMAGETWDNNIWTKAFEERLGVKFEYVWNCPSTEFAQKVNVAIASDELPELMHINYDQFYRLAVAGKLADITTVFDQYAGASLKKNMTQTANGVGLEMDKYQGKLYGVGNPPGYSLDGHMLWFRNDWLANVGMEAPKTWDDVIKLMYAFAQKDPNKTGIPTVGLGLSKSLFNTGNGVEGFFAAYGAYPTIWVKNGDKLEYGAAQAACKDALLQLQKLYKDGIIDPEFSIKGDWDNYPDEMVQDKIGLEFGPFWFSDWKVGDIMANHPNTATWTCVEIPAVSGGIAKRSVAGKQNMVLCMRADTKYPEAMIKLLNLGNALLTDEGTAEGKYHDQKDDKGEVVNNFFHFNDFVGDVGGNPDWNYECTLKVIDALKSGDAAKLNPEQKSYYDGAKAYLDGTDMKMYRRIATFGEGGSCQVWYESFKAGNVMANEYYGPNTDTMNAKLGNLESKRNDTFIRIIMGESIDEFDKWVEYFNAQGGKEITDEVNSWYSSK